jgi:hypothetical protein
MFEGWFGHAGFCFGAEMEWVVSPRALVSAGKTIRKRRFFHLF